MPAARTRQVDLDQLPARERVSHPVDEHLPIGKTNPVAVEIGPWESEMSNLERGTADINRRSPEIEPGLPLAMLQAEVLGHHARCERSSAWITRASTTTTPASIPGK